MEKVVKEFYLLSVIKDAHTEFHAPFIVKEERNDLFPFQIKLTLDNKKLIAETAVDSLFLLQISTGYIIISINGVSSEKIIAEIKNQICSVLAGYVWDMKNPYVSHHDTALTRLARVIELEHMMQS